MNTLMRGYQAFVTIDMRRVSKLLLDHYCSAISKIQSVPSVPNIVHRVMLTIPLSIAPRKQS